MAEDAFTIDLSPDSDISSVVLFAEVLDKRGQPLSGTFVTFRLQGEGSLDEISDVHTQQRRTSKQGVSVTWYEYPVQKPRLACKGTVTASCPDATSVRLRPGTLIPFNMSEWASIATMLPPQGEIPPEVCETESAGEAAVIADRPEPSTDALTRGEKTALFAMLSCGTAKHLGRPPTASEFVRLCDAVILARKLATIEGGLLSEVTEIYWTGNDWVIKRIEDQERRAA